MSSKISPRSKKLKHNKEDAKYETIVQVHRILKSDTSSEKDNQSNLSLSRTDNSEDGESNKAFQMEDYNENYNRIRTPTREISVDGETQINSKILSLIETEMKRDINKHSHFTDSRPQSLSFYEDEKIPEELSGNLELLSPEERKHYRRRKDHSQPDSDERKAYNAIQDLYNTRDGDEITTTKKSKSRKKRHIDAELGIGDSREMMIPKEKKKSKKKKRESNSPVSSSNKRKHKRREEEHEVKNDITIALEELQDDVFENSHEDYNRGKKVRENNPDCGDRLYVQKKNKFEVASRPPSRAMYKDPNCCDIYPQKYSTAPLDVAICIQKFCVKIFLPCHGLLAGLALGQYLYLVSNANYQNHDFLMAYANFNDIYITVFYLLITICIVSSLDRIDIGHIGVKQMWDCSMPYRIIGLVVLLMYLVGLIVHLSLCNIENKLGILASHNLTAVDLDITVYDIIRWNNISLWRFILVLVPWILVAASASDLDNMLYVHLQSMLKYLPEKCTCR